MYKSFREVRCNEGEDITNKNNNRIKNSTTLTILPNHFYVDRILCKFISQKKKDTKKQRSKSKMT